MDETEVVTEPKSMDAATLALLSLYLLTLAFFILLNTISHQQTDRTRAALGSIDATFSQRLTIAEEPQQVGVGRGPLREESPFQTELLRLFENQLPFAQYKIIKRGTVMRIFLPTDSLFEKDADTLVASRAPVLVGIADSLSRKSPGWRREVEIVMGSGPRLPASLAHGTSLALNRTGTLARKLHSLGVIPSALSIGLEPGDPGVITLTFYSRPEAAAKVDFDDRGE